ncbi:unnamed protein product [Prunus armeniaca]|uniref:DDE Tnp4 domain-containing protein n=1 Tax=Prunus armeniaca TaxID=36596 RepID=A0A6J5VU41_PRUAR|nr:unnamed protein product [Prunus armeniaca]
MLFTYVYTGWEGAANDSKVLMDAISREGNNFSLPKEGKYYLVGSGYANMRGFLAPYHGERYHLRDYKGRGKHPRYFGVLKAHFPILKLMSNYPIRK